MISLFMYQMGKVYVCVCVCVCVCMCVGACVCDTGLSQFFIFLYNNVVINILLHTCLFTSLIILSI